LSAMVRSDGPPEAPSGVPLWWHFHLMRQFVVIFSSHGGSDSHLMGAKSI
jgi:hypothetical protein